MTASPATVGTGPESARRELSIRRALTLSFSAIIVLLAAALTVLALIDRGQARADLAL